MPQNTSDTPETDTPTPSTVKIPPKVAAAYLAALAGSALPGEGDDMDKAALSDASQFAARAALERTAETPSLLLEPIAADGTDRRMRLVIINDDMPFLVDSTSQIVAAQGLAVHRILHPVVTVKRDAKGHLQEAGEGSARESVIYMELERGDARARRRLLDALEAALRDVRAAVRDWRAMRAAMLADAAMRVEGEAAELLRWFEGGAMTQLGHEWRTRDGKVQDPLGISESADGQLLSPAALEAAFAWFDQGGTAPLLIKSNRLSAVHRRVLLDLVIVPEVKGKKVDRLSIHAGLWTSAALSAPPAKVPVLRAQLEALMAKFGFDPTGHAGKALAHALTALPHDLLIAFDAASLEELVLTSMSITDRPRPKVVMVQSALGRHLFAFVWLPRDEVSTGRRLAVESLLVREAKAGVIGWTMVLEDGGAALLRYTLDLRSGGVVPDAEALNTQLEQMVRGWQPEVEAALAKRGDPGRAAALAARFAPTFPPNYRNLYNPEEAARDILRLRDLDAANPRSVRLARKSLDGDDRLRLKVYSAVGPLALSDVVPALEHFGFEVLEEIPTALQSRAPGAEGEDEQSIVIHDFTLRLPANVDELALLPYAEVLEGAIAAVLDGRAENDAFNELVLTNQTDPHAIVWLRAWFRYLRQGGSAYGMDTVVSALRHAPKLTAALIERFRALHDPKARDAKRADALAAEILADFADIKSIDEDRILRLFHAVISATLRTNAFAPAAEEALAFKIDSSLVPGLPKPLPWREVWVYSPRVEGIHLRAGPVARGGLRWSDRRDDFRTEILGLMKAQRVKNAVIVPTGAKGGFYPKALPDVSLDRDAWFAEGTECYRIFIRSLLSITDNLVAGKVVHPKGVVIHDGDDPYFVVAADKGTATFSDVANALAMERDFWLGDAFASGGSKGYDHKAMGITAKGAWLSVQRHFAEMGVDVQSDTIRVVGCGDMSGDVFGNGMLLSKAIQLTAAFDHRHIFLDPNPDPAKSWKERERMFNLPRSSWADYNEKLISKGGGIFPRSQKSITLTPEVQAMLGLSVSEIDPGSLISAILKAPADLLWFGGIGTYVKAASQNNAEVGDPANDALRVDAEDLRVKAVGEGANLGTTQAARIAFSAKGGRINTDFIDNSAGVDCSDNEVNIKIALNREMAEGRLSQDDRDALLVRMTDNVSELVLEDNRLQALALSIAEKGGSAAVPSLVRIMETFEASGRLDRKVEGLAANDELLRRAAEGRGLTRPELAVLLSTAKLALQDAIEHSDLPNDPALGSDLAAAFPDEMQRDFGQAIADHQLRREIIATKIANRIINRMGIVHPFELVEEEGCALGDIAAAFVAVERLLDLPAIWDALDEAKIDESIRLSLFSQAASAMTSQMADLLRVTQSLSQPGPVVARLEPGVDRLNASVDGLLSPSVKHQWDMLTQQLLDAGAPEALTASVVRLFKTDGAIGIVDLAERRGDDEVAVTSAFSHLGEALGLDWAQTLAAHMSPADPWERLLVNSLARDFQQMRLTFLAGLPKGDLDAAVTKWLADHAPRVEQFRATVDRARMIPTPNGAMLSHIAGQARGLLGR
ncbi:MULTISPECIES: NAD-glutamate dehydrogenase domain-containing protein [unclassified Sphingopyxis]|uniref:NAD-glutamate dehydrogenase n=1 Tax=unclassified Sphingopyxis TaxID=2614943 RepID=UPI0006C4EE15|nr:MULTISPECIES: NAD-glutamate dehydrogenase domain-containing protein [unclassified Sphingopyxis]USI77296.1 NAD-glutamate dehydrogenase [Sphingopyxis sp. USTB-05]GAO80232.1 NAD-specific glutamate dehydrogenase, large form [Sphingopyxis sp. C-1]